MDEMDVLNQEETGTEENPSRDDAGAGYADDNAPVNGESDFSDIPAEEIPGPTPEQEEEWERERKAAWEAKMKPFKELVEAVREHDELMADMLYELIMLEYGEDEEE